ncbi:FAD-binding oxidoreductase [Mycobacterium vicinigordonae]|uniref:FAD-binding oxidoreductase n=1 Tax=Mycobacterium vicinigordonae TaxID=1719132 RepID=A0A7D6E691_9MYCO|nr:FAD-dependent oxidoreductase [Mycobacterium vicinigordonae]QLL10166.1 FAD-binding oxidoreductase [Mycobacterium vicinigordonae]
MVDSEQIDSGPRSAIVVGAGIVGLSTAWFLQERGVDVTVVDGSYVGAGASGGNAGWIAPGLIVPLNSPAVLRYGLRSLLDPLAPLHIPARPDPKLAKFLLQFAASCRHAPRTRALRANVPLNAECVEAFEVLVGNGIDAPVTDAPITAVFRTSEQAQHLLAELREVESAGQTIDITSIVGAALREQVPVASDTVTAGLNINGQRFVDPGRFVAALCRAVIERGATTCRLQVAGIGTSRTGIAVLPSRGTALKADVVVLATGAQLSRLAGRWMRVPVRAGRGYSFTVPVERPVPGPIYLPDARVACTPYRGKLRVAGTMEFRGVHEPGRPERVDAIVASVRPLLDGVCWGARTDVWVGARPVTPDGRPVIGQVAPGVYVAGGHGMWGFAHGPVTGRLLAEQITTGKQPQELREFDPLRRVGR